MKKTEIVLYSLFVTGLVFKVFKLPMHTVFLLTVIFLLIVFYLATWINRRKNSFSAIAGLIACLWLFALLSILKHFPFQSIVFVASSVAGIGFMILVLQKKAVDSVTRVACLTAIVITLFFRFLPAHQTYYLTNIKFNHEIERDYFSWDKYSWFLFTEGKPEEALQANQNAKAAVELSLQNPGYGDESEYREKISIHEQRIKEGNWRTFH